MAGSSFSQPKEPAQNGEFREHKEPVKTAWGFPICKTILLCLGHVKGSVNEIAILY